MTDNTLAPVSLPSAKPYAGKAQTAAVGAALRRMVAAGWASSIAATSRARLQVVGRGTVVVDGVRAPAATVLYYKGEGATFEQVRTALHDAGWVLFDVRDEQAAGVWSSVEVVGPGVARWAERFNAAAEDAAVRKASAAESRGVAAARLKVLAGELGVSGLVGHVSEFSDSVSVPYERMVELLELLAAARTISEPAR